MIVDFHTHAYPDAIAQKAVKSVGDFYGMDLHTQLGTLADLRESAREAGVDRLCLLAVAVRAEQMPSINNWLAAQLDESTFGFAALHPDAAASLAELDRFGALGVSGAKVHPDMQQFLLDDEAMIPVYEKLAALGYPLLVHAGDDRYEYSRPARIARVLDRVPNLTVIAAHLGGYRRWEEARACLCGRANLYFDTSSALAFLPQAQAMELIRAHGTDKVLFGTDYPITRHKPELERFLALPLSPEEREQILSGNALRLLGR